MTLTPAGSTKRMNRRRDITHDRMPLPGPKFFDTRAMGSSELLTVAQAAKVLGVSGSGMRRLQQGRHIPFFKIGRCVRFARSDLAAYLSRRRIEPIG